MGKTKQILIKCFVLGLILLMMSNTVFAAKRIIDRETNAERDKLQKIQLSIAEAMRYTRDYFKAERLGRSRRDDGKENQMGKVPGLQPFQVGFADPDKFQIDQKYIDNKATQGVVQFLSEDTVKYLLERLKERETMSNVKIKSLVGDNVTVDPETLLGKMQIKEAETIFVVPNKFSEKEGRATVPKNFDPTATNNKYKIAETTAEREYAKKERAYYKQQELIEDLALILLAKEALPCQSQSEEQCMKELNTFEGMVKNAWRNSSLGYGQGNTIRDALAANYAIRAEWLKLLAVKRQIKLLAQKVQSYKGIQQTEPLKALMMSKKAGQEDQIEFQILNNEDVQNIGISLNQGGAWTI